MNKNVLLWLLTAAWITGCGYETIAPYTDAKAGDCAMPQSLDLVIPLDIVAPASNPLRFPVNGKFLAVDGASTGQATLKINTLSDQGRLIYPGATMAPPDGFSDLYFSFAAQPGKFLHIIYGDAPDILSAGSKSIPDPALPGTTYINNSAVTGATIIVTAAQNVNGIKILGGTVSIFTSAVANANGRCGISLNGTTTFIDVSSFNAVAGTLETKTAEIPQIYIPPGIYLQWDHQIINPNAGASIVLNYSLL
jgi:hypothetical protein